MRLHDYLEYWARIRPEGEFAVLGDARLSYAEADAGANRIANALMAAGLQLGDRVAYLSKNSLEFVLFYYGCSKCGAVPVPLNYRLAPPEWQFIVADAGAKLLFATSEFAGAIDGIRSELPSVKTWVSLGEGPEGWQGWQDFLGGAPETPPERDASAESELYQMYTSGTTGRPKGAVLLQRAVCQNLVQVGIQFSVRPGERSLIVAPLYHAAAGVCAFATVAAGGCLYVQEEFEPAAVVDALSNETISVALLVPAMIQFCLVAVPDVAERDYASLRLIVYGASAIAEQTLRQAVSTFGCGFIQAYGMTETTAVATNLTIPDHERALREKPELLLSAGRPVVGTRIRVVDENDEDVPTGEIGEILIRGPQLMQGYWNREEASAEALRGDWMHTGDAGVLDEEGYLYVQDRVKDMIISGAENIYPREIEEVLYLHEEVAEAAVIGVPDEKWGESVKAIVVLKAGSSASPDEIMAFCAGRLGGYKRPRSVDFIEALPRNLSGKVLKKDLREPYWRGHGRRVN
ncbi:MAG: long-chain-fatty-acid--CoA ligase [Myxococcota bacterium]